MDVNRLLEILMHGNQLKRTIRSGWVQRGVPAPESVAAHSFGVTFATMILAELIDEPVDLATALAMAALHDLPEGLTTDIPAPAWRYLPQGSKAAAERQAMERVAGDAPFASRLLALWEALRLNATAEARLVHDADKLDTYLQAYVYERQTGNKQLEEFWVTPHLFHYPQAQALYEELRRLRGTPSIAPLASEPG